MHFRPRWFHFKNIKMKVKLKKILGTPILAAWFLALAAFQLQSQPGIVVSGKVVFGQAATPVPGYPVDVVSGNFQQTAITDENGYYSAAVANPNPGTTILVIATDWCTGVTEARQVPGPDGSYTADFHICAEVDNPPVDSACAAFFTYEQVGTDPYVVAFYDLSVIDSGIESWTWSFGDGTAGTGPNPEHVFSDPGLYPVTLTVTGGDCSASFTLQVAVNETLDCNCPAVYDPVCVLVNGLLLQFGNACEAECAGYDPSNFVECEDDPCVCDQVYDPVCVVSPDGQVITFPNSCYAECAGFGPDQYVPCQDCVCPDNWDPVCVATPGGVILTFSNACEAECAGYGPDIYYACDSTGCACPTIYDPVCVVDPAQGDTLTFANSCLAECAGYGPNEYFSCDGGGGCQCYEIYAPVCVMVDSTIIEFPNDCFAACAGYGPESFVDCGPGNCYCPEYYDPVCAVSPAGDTLTFSNICFALCEGYGQDQVFSCGTPSDCDACPAIYDPVCVIAPNGIFLTFPNICVAVCSGYNADEVFHCNDPVDSTGCQAWFFVEYTDPAGFAVQFQDQSYGASEIITWQWSFGDGTASQEQNPVHGYPAEGIYPVTLTITTADGCTSSYTEHVCVGNGGGVQGTECQAMFVFQQSGDNPFAFQFEDLSVGEPVNWFWEFGDGSVSQDPNPQHTYNADGLYLVTLTIVTENGCSSSMVMIVAAGDNVIYGDSLCQALFLPFIEQDSLVVFFLNLSTPAGQYTWDFGDGTTSSEFMPFHFYNQPGIYVVTLTITGPDGCTNTFSATIDLIENNIIGRPDFALATASEEPAETLDWKVYPNPAREETRVEWTSGKGGAFTLQLLDLNGKIIWTHRDHAPKGAHSERVDTGQLIPGIYLLRIQTEDGVGVRRFVRQ